MADTFVSVILAAAGMSRRMGTTSSKQLLLLNGIRVMEYSLKAFSECDEVGEIIIVAKEADFPEIEKFLPEYPKIKCLVMGGKERIDSVKNGFRAVSKNADIVAIHDAARPLITKTLIQDIIEKTKIYGAVCPVSVINDTVKESTDGDEILSTRDRNSLFLAQTPQMFKTDIYEKSLDAVTCNVPFTDDASIVENAGFTVHLHKTDAPNIKITHRADLELCEFYIRRGKDKKGMRIGHGYDVHKLVLDRDLVLGGVKIPHTHGLLGHSDADVLTHAVMDAIIGALGLGDIGKHFPDTDEKYRGISSMKLLEHTKKLLDENGAKIINIDATVIAQKPKLAEHIPEMRKNIAEILQCSIAQINVKATTEEGLGFTGDLSGISAHAVVIIEN